MRTACGVVLIVWSVCAIVSGQDRAKTPAFEVASIKPSPPRTDSSIGISGTTLPGGRWSSRYATLERIIRAAYPGHALPSQLVGGPAWVRSTMFDISATAASATATLDELRAMARTLLAERFKLVLRTEMRDVSGYALVLARSDRTLGPALRPSTVDCEALRAAVKRGAATGPPSTWTCNPMVTDSDGLSRIVARRIELNRLAALIGPRVDAPVVDATGLTGAFDVSLEFADEIPAARAGDVPSIFTALQEQLGLRLERRPVPVEVLVIERVEPPTPD
jgi:uncharacterized protein (TIGR03435 family)